ncbi:hypothetical protein [Janthinobacterium psychrotolerans]|uniref:hypothetical protein n=1 Tax=Janthinobacterium psychrotolerans TaxID=1747903 RepID=UPI0012376E9C|nr:hypothetical protein [Janthinobacterium psychrotolerans]
MMGDVVGDARQNGNSSHVMLLENGRKQHQARRRTLNGQQKTRLPLQINGLSDESWCRLPESQFQLNQ